jgi:hypothetical protein
MCYSIITHCKVVFREPSALICAVKVNILVTEKLLFLYIIELQNIYVYKSEPIVC